MAWRIWGRGERWEAVFERALVGEGENCLAGEIGILHGKVEGEKGKRRRGKVG